MFIHLSQWNYVYICVYTYACLCLSLYLFLSFCEEENNPLISCFGRSLVRFVSIIASVISMSSANLCQSHWSAYFTDDKRNVRWLQKVQNVQGRLRFPGFYIRISFQVREETTDLRSDGGGIRFDFTMDIEDRCVGPVLRKVYGTSTEESLVHRLKKSKKIWNSWKSRGDCAQV